jgi:hypothetical protein
MVPESNHNVDTSESGNEKIIGYISEFGNGYSQGSQMGLTVASPNL